MTKPDITLLLAPAAAGKTAAAIEALRAPRRGWALLLVPNRRERQRLIAHLELEGVPRVQVHQFYSLAGALLGRAKIAVTELSGTMRTLLLRRVLRELAADGRLPTFARVAHKPGFITNVGTLIDEARDAGVAPAELANAHLTPYDAELGAVYAAYLAALKQHGLADITRRLRLTREALRTNPRLLAGVRLLVVDGFDQFTPLQLGLLTDMSRSVAQTIITLTGGAAERPAHRRFARTRQQIVTALQPTTVQVLNAWHPTAADQHPVLTFLEQHLFNLDLPPRSDPGDALTLIAAADREREVRAALRRVRTLLAQGIAPGQIALLFRSGAAYLPLLREVAAEYALPLAIYAGQPLVESPRVVAALTMLRLPLENYPRRELVETWRSFGEWRAGSGEWGMTIGSEQGSLRSFAQAASLLDRVARNAGIASGLERLCAALTALATAEPPLEDDEERDPLAVAPTTAQELLALLDAFAAWLTPPERATIGEYVAWVRERTTETIAGTSDGEASADAEDAAAASPPTPQLDSATRWLTVLNELAQAAATLNEPPVSYNAFIADLSTAVVAANYGRVEPESTTVAALPVLAARGICFDHTIVLGLAQGEFPLQFPDPPFYSRRERNLLARQGIRLTPPDPADERSLFYEIIGRTRQSLTLARTYLDEQSNPLPPSPYLTALLDLVERDQVPTIWARAGSVPPLAEAASPQEALIAQMATGAPAQTELPAQQPPTALLAHVQRACEIEAQREGTGAYTQFEGMLNDAEIAEELTRYFFGPTHHWSITQINDYITCPFRFAAVHLLKLKPRTEPEDDLERSTRGRIYHAIMAEAGKTWMQTQHAHTADNEPVILEMLHAAADTVLAAAPTRYGFEPNAFWGWDQADIRRRLERALRRVLREQSDWAAFKPAGVEQSFGMKSGARALRLDTPAGPVLVAGRIDRLDQREDGALALLDYKSSSTPRSPEETLSGQDVQLAIYLLAVEQVLARGQRVERAAFLHLGSGKRSKPLTDAERERAIGAMQARVAETVIGARAGHFPVQPRDMCPTHCTYATICRLNLVKRDMHKTNPSG